MAEWLTVKNALRGYGKRELPLQTIRAIGVFLVIQKTGQLVPAEPVVLVTNILRPTPL